MGGRLGKGRVDDYFLPQNYSWYDAKLYFSKALADDEAYNVNYGKAWRAVGETMHLIADLTLPPHVRNDGHASFFGGSLGDAEPVETSTTGQHVIRYYQATGGWSTAINYNQDVIKMMRQIARWTNSNFLSQDTIPLAGNPNTSNGFPAFPSPALAGRTPDENGYIWYQVDGRALRMARTSSLYRWGLSGNPAYFLDNVVIDDQRSILLPTAVRAAEAVLERFLPRFKVEAQVKPDPRIPGRYQVHGRLVQGQDNVTGYEWHKYGRLIIRNGARIIVNSKQIIPVKVITREEELNEFTRDISIEAGPTISVVVSYDLGGYVVQSEPVTAKPAPEEPKSYWCHVCLEDTTGIKKYYFSVTFSRDGKQYGPEVSTTDLESFGCVGESIEMERGKYTANIKYGPPAHKQNEIKMEVSIPENLDKNDNLRLVVPKFGFK